MLRCFIRRALPTATGIPSTIPLPLPWQRFKFRDRRGGNALLFRILHDGFGERMLGKLFYGRAMRTTGFIV